MTKYLDINIDLSRDKELTGHAASLLKEFYCLKEEASPQQAFARASSAYSAGDKELAQRIYDYVSKGWFMFSSPILSNAPLPNREHQAMPISCFLSYVGDNLEGLIGHHAETAWLSVKGGGVGGHWSAVRSISEKSVGVLPMLKVNDSQMTAYKQGRTRKGSYAAYLDVNHPDIIEFINFKLPTGGDINRKCFNLFNAVNITDDFMDKVFNNEGLNLVDPHSKEVVDTVSAKDLWHKMIEVRYRTGSPYLNFIDTANKSLPHYQKELGLSIKGSNLCNEIHLATSEDRTAVCCLSSVNLAHYDEWKDSNMVADLVTYLDNVLEAFINEAPDELGKAVYSATRERAIGIGAMGFHDYLQSNKIAWESWQATSANYKMFKDIKAKAVEQTEKLATLRGECPDGKGFNVRNSHLLAVAPNANSSILCDSSASIEPIKSNMFTQRTRAGAFVQKNKNLEKLLVSYGKNTEDTWNIILRSDGSVQGLDFLTDLEKETYKTAMELDQHWVVEHAAKRQEFICQGQSVNLFFPANAHKKYANSVHVKAYKAGLKGLYYLRTEAGQTADKVGAKVEREALEDYKDVPDCLSCEG